MKYLEESGITSSLSFLISDPNILSMCSMILIRRLKCVKNCMKVTILGAVGGIGQALALFLKTNPMITCLALYDIAKSCPGVAEDLSHINNCCIVEAYTGECEIADALACSHIVVIAAGMPRQPGMTRQELLRHNANIIIELSYAIARFSPYAFVAIITNPVNSMVPTAVSVMLHHGVCPINRVFGVTTLDLVRASTFVGEAKCLDPSYVHVPVIGGHSGETIVPLLSQCEPAVPFTQHEIERLTSDIQNAGTYVVEAKAGAGSATLSTAYAAAQFVCSLLRALSGEQNVVEYAYIRSRLTEVPYFASPFTLDHCGVSVVHHYGTVSDYEEKLIKKAIEILKKDIEVDFKVAIIGAASRMGQILAMLLKLNTDVTELALFDTSKNTAGIGMDISHIKSKPLVKYGFEKYEIYETLNNANIVVFTQVSPRKRGKQQHLLRMNADLIFSTMRNVVTHAPKAFIVVATMPVNTLVPMVAEYTKKAHTYDPRKIFGVTTAHQIRASTFVGRTNFVDPASQYVPVIGGNDGPTIVPLISQCNPPFKFGQDRVQSVTMQIQTAESSVIKKKHGEGSSVLTQAFGTGRFVNSLLNALKGEQVIECAFVRSDVTSAEYFATPLIIDKEGTKRNLGIGEVSYFEKRLIETAIPILKENAKDAVRFIQKRDKAIMKVVN